MPSLAPDPSEAATGRVSTKLFHDARISAQKQRADTSNDGAAQVAARQLHAFELVGSYILNCARPAT
jgi:hypothetical protein